mgnify:CR=1 FL=1
MLNFKSTKLALVALTAATLAGCQSSAVDYEGIRLTSNQQAAPTGKSLGAGFVKGMTPEQTCTKFKENFKTPNNELCKTIGRKSFSNLTLVQRDIDDSHVSNQTVGAIAFFFDKGAKLNYVQAISPEQLHQSDNNHRKEFLRPSRTKPRASGK